MKKITFILFALIAGTTFAQITAEATAVVNAEIVSPITITNSAGLNFGTINGTATGGDVTVTTGGTRTFTNSDMSITSATDITAAKFSVIAAETYIYSISIPGATLTESGGDTMAATFVHNRNTPEGRTGSGAAQPLFVGGTLTVGGSQTAGSYTGEVKVTVAYE